MRSAVKDLPNGLEPLHLGIAKQCHRAFCLCRSSSLAAEESTLSTACWSCTVRACPGSCVAVFRCPGGALAITFGHVVLARDEAALTLTRMHERVHVRQYERWGPAFIPAYVLASAWGIITGTGDVSRQLVRARSHASRTTRLIDGAPRPAPWSADPADGIMRIGPGPLVTPR
jgi:hypothetical protein